MTSVPALYHQVRQAFPEITALADTHHQKRCGDSLDQDFEYAWFEALADAINKEMQREQSSVRHVALFELLAAAFRDGPELTRNCIDVSFVENLFWSVPSIKCAPYWKQLPQDLRRLYIDFHHREP